MRTFKDIIREQGENAFKVKVVTMNGSKEFTNLSEAKKVYPTLDPFKNTTDFTWAMKDGEGMRFEDWATENMLSS
jgi:hypothetical protein